MLLIACVSTSIKESVQQAQIARNGAFVSIPIALAMLKLEPIEHLARQIAPGK